MIYRDRHKSFSCIAWDCVPIALTVLFLSSYWGTSSPDGVDLRRELEYVAELQLKFALVFTFFVFITITRQTQAPLWFSILQSTLTFFYSVAGVIELYYHGRDLDMVLYQVHGEKWPPSRWLSRKTMVSDTRDLEIKSHQQS